MKLVMFSRDAEKPRPGVLVESGIADLLAVAPQLPETVQDILATGKLGAAAEAASEAPVAGSGDCRLHAPITRPGKILCIGLNYRDHAIESGMAIPEEPIVFAKFSTSITGPEMPICLPAASQEVDYEAELVVVIGRRASKVVEAQAIQYVAGYTVGNDVSARDWQLRKPGGQWMLGKSFDTFAPIGPALVTRDEVPDPHALSISFTLNGKRMQHSSTDQLIFRIEQIIAYLSQIAPLEPGDLIFTGTPPGVGFARKPPVLLQPGDVCEATVDRLGTLRNHCVAESHE